MKELKSTDIVGTSGIRIWMTYPLMIRWKKIQRDELDSERKENIISGINSSIIVDCTCFLEEILDLLIREKIYFQEDGSYEERINDQLLDRLQNAQFNEYQSLFYLVYGKELSNITENQTWKMYKITIFFS